MLAKPPASVPRGWNERKEREQGDGRRASEQHLRRNHAGDAVDLHVHPVSVDQIACKERSEDHRHTHREDHPHPFELAAVLRRIQVLDPGDRGLRDQDEPGARSEYADQQDGSMRG